MKKRLSILALLGLTIATIAFGVDKLIDAPSGDLILDSGNKVIIKKAIEAQVQSPGFIPVGGMVAVMPHVSGSWQPPATGVVKDGFMRADGATVSDAESPLNGQVLPTMTSNTYARGDSTTGYTSPHVGGANTQASNVSVGNHSELTLESILDSHSSINIAHGHGFTNPYVPGHYHGMGTGANLNVTSSGGTSGTESSHTHAGTGSLQTNTGTTVASNSHTHASGSYYAAIELAGSTIKAVRAATSTTSQVRADIPIYGDSSHMDFGVAVYGTSSTSAGTTSLNNIPIDGSTGAGSSHSHSINHTHAAGNIAGSIGLVTNGCNGNAGNTCQTTDGAVTALGTTNKTISAHDFTSDLTHSVTNNAVNNEPKYLSVIWVIRVK